MTVAGEALLPVAADTAVAPAPDLQRQVHCILGLPFDAVSLEDAASKIRIAAKNRTRCFLSTANMNFVRESLDDETFRDSIVCSDLSVPDGMPIVWVAKLLSIPIVERVSGSALIEYLVHSPAKQKTSIYFFGGPDGAAREACRQLNSEPRGLHCCGFDSAGFGSLQELSSAEAINRINASGANILSVSLGARKGQAWILRNLDSLAVPVVVHLGAVVNFLAGTVRRAPVWVQKIGLEWLWRIREEPTLWKRYSRDGATLLALLITRVLPLAMQSRRRTSEPGGPELAWSEGSGKAQIELRGAWTHETLAPLREAFRLALAGDQDLCVDLSRVSKIDSAFLGLLMLVYGHQRICGRNLVLHSPTPAIRRVFRLSCAEFLLSRSEAR